MEAEDRRVARTGSVNRERGLDVLRGFALVGVLFANFTSFNYQQVPQEVSAKLFSNVDQYFVVFNSVFVEWKFLTLFSLMFGYGFGLILESCERKGLNSSSVFLRRMFWLFLFGCVHTLFWTPDILHLYAVAGLFLLFFRSASNLVVGISAVFLIFGFSPAFNLLFGEPGSYFSDADRLAHFETLRNGSLIEIFAANANAYYLKYLANLTDIVEIAETTGRFLLGYLLVRIGAMRNIKERGEIYIKGAVIFCVPAVIYLVSFVPGMPGPAVGETLSGGLIKLGIISTAAFYGCLLLIFYSKTAKSFLWKSFEVIGRMTLTNYLLVSAINVFLLYGFGFGLLGQMKMSWVWLIALVSLFILGAFSFVWLRSYQYGPLEGVWRRLTYSGNRSS